MVNLPEVDEQGANEALAFPYAASNLPAVAEKFAAAEKSIVEHLNTQTEDEIYEIRRRAGLYGTFSWRIEAACDAEIWSRHKSHKGVKGSVARGVGRVAAIRRRAKQIGCTPNTIFKNFQIYDLIRRVEDNPVNISKLQVLDEKGFYVAALTAADPERALLLLGQKKTELKRFRVSDAFRFLEREGLTKKIAANNAVAAVRTASRSARFAYLKKVQSILLDCPDTKLFKRLFQDCLADVNDEVEEMFDEEIVTAIQKSYGTECRDGKSLSIATGFTEENISRVIQGRLCDEFILIPNSNPKKWHKVGEPLPPELRKNQR